MSEQASEQLTRLMNMLEDLHEKAVYGGVQNTFAKIIGKHKIDICVMYGVLESKLAAAEARAQRYREALNLPALERILDKIADSGIYINEHAEDLYDWVQTMYAALQDTET